MKLTLSKLTVSSLLVLAVGCSGGGGGGGGGYLDGGTSTGGFGNFGSGGSGAVGAGGALPSGGGTVLLGQELLHYTWVRRSGDQVSLEMPRWYPAGDFGNKAAARGLFRGRYGTAAQGASGGGDYPEASDAALTDMTNLAWREDETTARLAFWVADAPHHEARTAVITEAIRTASQLDVHIYPVASSGVDVRTETSMRSAAQLTGGRYLFLTDDSGVGGSHLEPSIPCYFVTLLSNAMLRMVDIEMSGVYREPEAAQIIRTGGDPTDRACTLDSGKIVYAF